MKCFHLKSRALRALAACLAHAAPSHKFLTRLRRYKKLLKLFIKKLVSYSVFVFHPLQLDADGLDQHQEEDDV